jgi:2-iminobutanoate/2-iminopropanoate deaminase
MKKIIYTDKAPKVIGPYSQAVEINDSIFISGQIPIVPETGEIIAGGITEQTEQVLKNIELILSSAGYTMVEIVKTICILADINDFAAMNAVYSKYFVKEFPARSTFEASALPRKVLVEIDAIAVKKKFL